LNVRYDQPLGAIREPDHHVLPRLQVVKPAAMQNLDMHEDVAGFGVAHHEAVIGDICSA
jgi:hypothetical protein